jgi:signal transduction histidine kinase
MTADTPLTVNVSTPTHPLSLMRLDIVAPQRSSVVFWLAYRWLSLLPVCAGMVAVATGSTEFSPASLFLLIALGTTLLITIFSRTFSFTPLETACFLLIDLAGGAGLLAFSGNVTSPYFWYALSPLLASALLFQWRGALWSAGLFTLLYLLALPIGTGIVPISLALDRLLTQLFGFWLVPLLLGYPLHRVRRFEQEQEVLQTSRDNLTRRHIQLLAAHEQLEIIHDVTLLLQGASELQSVQQRVLRAVTAELGFAKAMIGLVNPATQHLGEWQLYPPPADFDALTISSLPLTPEHGLLAQALLDGHARWWINEEPLAADETLNAWLSQSAWLIVPLVLPEQPVGLLLIAVEGGPGSLTDDQLVVLTAVASQAAAALETIDRAQRLATEQERNRIARDIHDTLAQSLFGMVFTLDACIKMLPQQGEAVQQELVELRQLADQVRHEIRRFILDTWPSELTWEQFKTDLDKYVAHFAPAYAFSIEFTINGNFDRLPAVIRRSLYRVSQEALANTARHAGVDSARLTMHVEPAEVYLSISDRGKGFEPKLALAREVNRERFGLRGMQERAQSLEGTCDILSQSGQGTQILVRVPVKRRNERD